MNKYTVTLAANIRAYATITIEAETRDAAWQRAEDIAAAAAGLWSEPEMYAVFFDPEYDTLDNIEVLDDIEQLDDPEMG